MEHTSPINRWRLEIEFLEQGDIYFFYKPKRSAKKVAGINDVARFFFVLDPSGDSPPRYIVMGNKKMPELTDGSKTNWGFIQIVGGRGFKTHKTLTNNRIKNASRPSGEGIYSIISHRDHTHLLYSLELPRKIGPVQKAFNIKEEANYVFMNRPTKNSPTSFEEPFSNFSPVSSRYLNERGTEILLVGVGEDIGRLGISAKTDFENVNTADIFSKLEVDRERHPIDALIKGEWE